MAGRTHEKASNIKPPGFRGWGKIVYLFIYVTTSRCTPYIKEASKICEALIVSCFSIILAVRCTYLPIHMYVCVSISLLEYRKKFMSEILSEIGFSAFSRSFY